MERKLTSKEIMRKRKALRRKAQIRKIASLALAASLGIVGTFAYLVKADSGKNYVPEVKVERIADAKYKTLESYTPNSNRNYEIRKSSVRVASSYIVTYADVFFYGKVLEIGTKGDDTLVSFQCLDDKRSNPIIVTFSGTVDLLPGDRVKIYGSYLNDVGDRVDSFEGITVENPEDTIYINGHAIVAL